MVSFGSVLVFLLCICNVYLTPTSWHHLLTREEPWNQSFVKDMECLWSLARLLAKEKTDMNTHQKIARCSVLCKQCKLSISVIGSWCNCWRTQLALSAVQVLTLHWETLLSKTLLDVKKWFPSVRFLSSCFCICYLYLARNIHLHLGVTF